MDQVKQAFSIELVDGFKRAYGGQMPSIATIARDFSLKSPQLPHISNEAIRKWIRGDSLPHVSRMQVLIEWLGPRITAPFDKPTSAIQLSQKVASSNKTIHETNGQSHHAHDELLEVIEKLTEKECQSILAIARLLAEKSD